MASGDSGKLGLHVTSHVALEHNCDLETVLILIVRTIIHNINNA